jgi:hypothetical protein
MRVQRTNAPTDMDTLEAYIHKNSYNRSDARRMKRALRKLMVAA